MKFLFCIEFITSLIFAGGSSDSLYLSKALKAKRVYATEKLDAPLVIVDSLKSTSKLDVNGDIAGATLNTGNGANELYPMDQDVRTTASVDFANIGSSLVNYSNTSTVTGWSSTTTKNIYYKKTGKLINVWFAISGTSNSTSTTFTLPYSVSSGTGTFFLTRQMNNSGSYEVGTGFMSGSNMYARNTITAPTNASWTASGTKYIEGQFSYITD